MQIERSDQSSDDPADDDNDSDADVVTITCRQHVETQYQSTGDKIELLESQVSRCCHHCHQCHNHRFIIIIIINNMIIITSNQHHQPNAGCRGEENCRGVRRQM